MTSPYDGHPVSDWPAITIDLVGAHPLSRDIIRDAVLEAWEEIFRSKVGSLAIGKDIFPTPQIMGTFLHELIPIEIGKRSAGWRRGKGIEKDTHYVKDPAFSVEIKTSSGPNVVVGNRSYGQEGSSEKGEKSGYYIAVNFGKWPPEGDLRPEITRIRFGWIDKADWIPQASPTGQSAPLSGDAKRNKLIDIM